MTIFYNSVPYNGVSYDGHYNDQGYRKYYSKSPYTVVPYTAVSYNGMFPKTLPLIMVIFNYCYRGFTVLTVPLQGTPL